MVTSNQIRSNQNQTNQTKSDQIRIDGIIEIIDQIKPHQTRLSDHQITSGHIRSDLIRPNQIRSHPVTSGQTRSDPTKLEQIRSDQINPHQIRCPRNLPEVCPESIPKFARSLSGVCPEFARNLCGVCPKIGFQPRSSPGFVRLVTLCNSYVMLMLCYVMLCYVIVAFIVSS